MSNWPQFLTLAWMLVGLTISAHRDSARFTAFANVVGALSARAIILGVLWAGGFFAPLGFAP